MPQREGVEPRDRAVEQPLGAGLTGDGEVHAPDLFRLFVLVLVRFLSAGR
jgi:hypothetical protein